MSTQLPLPKTETPIASKVRGRSSLPFCERCGLHIGSSASPALCGSCKRDLKKLPVALLWNEWRRLSKLVKKHWGTGSVRDLLLAANGTAQGYRPALITVPHARLSLKWTPDERRAYLAECAERGELADLYDRAQASRNDNRRAVRI